MAAKNKSNEIHITRIYEASVEDVWKAWTDPVQTAKWWGPRGFTTTTHSKDLRVGGHWNYTMHGPDGTDYPNSTHYFEVEPNKKLVYDHGGNADQPPMFRVTVLFSTVKFNDKPATKMEMTMALPTPEKAEETRKFIKAAGGNGTWDRLAEYLEKESTGREQFVINRTFDAPLETMFDLWTDPTHMTQWTPPTGFTMKFINVDVKPGGGGFYVMSDATGKMKMYGKTKYLQIERPHRIVYEQEFSDEKGNTARHPMSSTWPAKMLTTVLFNEEGPDQTRVTVIWEPTGEVSKEELATFIQARGGMTQGWTGSFDKLEAYVEQQHAASN